MIALPDAEQLLTALIAQMRPQVSATVGLVGILTGGAWIAERLHRALNLATAPAALDVSFYRDDFAAEGLKHEIQPSRIPFEIDGRDLILVDDVLYTGRTVRAALDALADLGRAESIQLAVLVDRGERELPIRADYVGKNVQAPGGQRVYVRLSEVDGADAVVVGNGK